MIDSLSFSIPPPSLPLLSPGTLDFSFSILIVHCRTHPSSAVFSPRPFFFLFLNPLLLSLILPPPSLLLVSLFEQHSQLQGFFFFTLQMVIVLLHSRGTHTDQILLLSLKMSSTDLMLCLSSWVSNP